MAEGNLASDRQPRKAGPMLDAYLQAHPIILGAILAIGWTIGLWHELRRP